MGSVHAGRRKSGYRGLQDHRAANKTPSADEEEGVAAPDDQASDSVGRRGFLTIAQGHFQQMNPPVVGAQHLEMEAAQVHGLAALGQPTQLHHHQPADGIGPLVAEGRPGSSC
jgi:hypothetical protein